MHDDGLIPRQQAERLILATTPAELLRTAAMASGPEHHGRADLDLRRGEIVMGHSKAGAPKPPACGSGRLTLWRVAAGEVEFPEEDFEDEEAPDVDDLEMLGAEMYALQNLPGVTAEEVLDGVGPVLDDVYGEDGR